MSQILHCELCDATVDPGEGSGGVDGAQARAARAVFCVALAVGLVAFDGSLIRLAGSSKRPVTAGWRVTAPGTPAARRLPAHGAITCSGSIRCSRLTARRPTELAGPAVARTTRGRSAHSAGGVRPETT
jgi:hypothetical protein